MVIVVLKRLMKSEDTFQTFSVENVDFVIKTSVTNVTFELDNVILCPNVDSVQLCSTCKYHLEISDETSC